MKAVKRILRYLKEISYLGLWYPKGENFNLVGYSNSYYAGFLVDGKSTSGTTHFLGECLVSWATMKKNSVVLSSAKAEYVAAASCCSQLLWIKQQLKDFGMDIGTIRIYYDNTSAIDKTKNPMHYKRTTH